MTSLSYAHVYWNISSRNHPKVMLKPQLNLDNSPTSKKNPKTLPSSEKLTVESVVVAYKNSRTQFLSFAHLPHLSNLPVIDEAASEEIVMSDQVPQRASLDQEKRPSFNVINIGLKERNLECLEITNYVSPGTLQQLTRSCAGTDAGTDAAT